MTQPLALVVDDEDSLRRYAARILQRNGYRTMEAGNGLEALCLMRASESRVDLLVTDIRMPEMDGGELAIIVRDEFPHVVIVLVSGYTDDEEYRRLRSSFEVVAKPFEPKRLLDAVSKVSAMRAGSAERCASG